MLCYVFDVHNYNDLMGAYSHYRDTMSKSRVIAKKILSVEQSEGVGARVRRSVGRPEVYYQ